MTEEFTGNFLGVGTTKIHGLQLIASTGWLSESDVKGTRKLFYRETPAPVERRSQTQKKKAESTSINSTTTLPPPSPNKKNRMTQTRESTIGGTTTLESCKGGKRVLFVGGY